jgi:hypothetical protein
MLPFPPRRDCAFRSPRHTLLLQGVFYPKKISGVGTNFGLQAGWVIKLTADALNFSRRKTSRAVLL